MRFMLPSSVRLNLALVVLAGLLPLMAIIIHSGLERREHEIEHAKLTTMRLAELFANQQENENRRLRLILEELARTPAVRGRDIEACTALFQKALD